MGNNNAASHMVQICYTNLCGIIDIMANINRSNGVRRMHTMSNRSRVNGIEPLTSP